MPIEFTINRARGLTLFEVSEGVSFGHWLRALARYEKRGPTKDEIFDCRLLEGDMITAEQIEQLAWRTRNNARLRPEGSRTAMVVSQEVHFGLARIFQQIVDASGVPWKTRIFWTLDGACRWLDVDYSIVGDMISMAAAQGIDSEDEPRLP